MKRKITDTAARTLCCPPDKREIFVRDTELRGFGMRVSRNVTSFIYETSVGGKSKRVTIGQWPAWTADEAREAARELRQRADAGHDLSAKRKRMADVWQRHLDTDFPSFSVSQQRNRRRHMTRYILPAIGKRPLPHVTFADCEDIHRSIPKPYEANRCLETLQRLFELAIKWGWCDKNPARGEKRNPEYPRNEYLAPKEIEALFAALPVTSSGDLIRILLLTGCRPGEAKAMTWGQVNLDAHTWTKPATTTKQRREHRVPLSPDAVAIIERQPKRGPLVFTRVDGQPVKRVDVTWKNALRDAGLPHHRLYACRHSVASMLASSGVSLQVVGAVLGHSQIATTQRYAHLYDEEVRKAVDIVAFTTKSSR